MCLFAVARILAACNVIASEITELYYSHEFNFHISFKLWFFFVFEFQAITLAKTCEATTEMRECRTPKDWSLLALQNTRTGKSHYLVICKCPEHYKMGELKLSLPIRFLFVYIQISFIYIQSFYSDQ